MKTRTLALAASLFLLTVLCLSALPDESSEVIYKNTLRLHVLANSDSALDQALKLEVRDEMERTVSGLFSDCKSIEEAKIKAEENLLLLQEKADKIISENGFDYRTSVTLSKEAYPIRKYKNLTFPAGKYVSLRVKIGKAAGKNWWCVLFPPLCLESCTEEESERALVSVFGNDAAAVLYEEDNSKPQYKVKFKIVELIKDFFG